MGRQLSQRRYRNGVLNESGWSQIEPATDFWNYFPTDSTKAKVSTGTKTPAQIHKDVIIHFLRP